jgi:hypothetical protein
VIADWRIATFQMADCGIDALRQCLNHESGIPAICNRKMNRSIANWQSAMDVPQQLSGPRRR